MGLATGMSAGVTVRRVGWDGTFVDGLSSFLTTWSGVHTAFSFNNSDQNTGTDTTHDCNSTTYAQAETGVFSNYGLAAGCDADSGGDFDNFINIDCCMMLYLPSSGYTENQVYGITTNGGAGNAQSAYARYASGGTGWQIAMTHNQTSGSEELVYTIGTTTGWYCVGFQWNDGSGDWAIWVNGTQVTSATRTYALAQGGLDPDVGKASTTSLPSGWSSPVDISGKNLLIANFVMDSVGGTASSVSSNGSSFFTDYFNEHT